MKKFTSIRLEITSKCNLRCAYCHNLNYLNSNDDMTTEEILKLVSNLKKSNNINKVLLTGGEPLLNKDILKIIEYISNLGIKVDMVTNATLLNDELIYKLGEAGLKRIRLSIDDINSVNTNRSNINSQSIIKKIKKIVEYGKIQVCIHTVATTENVEDLYNLYKTILDSGARRWRVFDVGYQGGIIKNKKKIDLKNYYKKLIASSKTIIKDYLDNNHINDLDIEINNIFKTSFLTMNVDDYKDFSYEESYKKIMNQSPCNYVTNHQLTIRSNGDATLCQYFRNPIYHTVNGKMVSSNVKPVESTIKLKDINYCKNCKYVLNCKSGCRSRALYFTNDIREPDPTACVLHKYVCEEIIPILPDNVKYIYNIYTNNNGLPPKYTVENLYEIFEKDGFKNE